MENWSQSLYKNYTGTEIVNSFKIVLVTTLEYYTYLEHIPKCKYTLWNSDRGNLKTNFQYGPAVPKLLELDLVTLFIFIIWFK